MIHDLTSWDELNGREKKVIGFKVNLKNLKTVAKATQGYKCAAPRGQEENKTHTAECSLLFISLQLTP